MGQLVLLIEPDKIQAGISKKFLESQGFRVALALSAQSAIDRIDEEIPSIVVLEVQLASHNGIEFLYEFRSYHEWQGIPVVIYSSVPIARFKQMNKELAQLGVVSILDKSETTISELSEEIKKIL